MDRLSWHPASYRRTLFSRFSQLPMMLKATKKEVSNASALVRSIAARRDPGWRNVSLSFRVISIPHQFLHTRKDGLGPNFVALLAEVEIVGHDLFRDSAVGLQERFTYVHKKDSLPVI